MSQDEIEAAARIAREKLIAAALAWANFSAGEGLCCADGSVSSPEDFLFDYATATGDEDYDTYAKRLSLTPPASETAKAEPSGEGPQPVPSPGVSCTGCVHLKTEWWKEYLDNDETDSGTSARCAAKPTEHGGESITAYWSDGRKPPEWCPFLSTQPIAQGRREAVEAMRERCARVADDAVAPTLGGAAVRDVIAAAIRALPAAPEGAA